MGAEFQASSFEGNNSQSPGEVLNEALSKINNEGKVLFVDNETGEQFLWPPHQPAALEMLPRDVYNHKMLLVARSLYGAVSQMQSFPETRDTVLQNLAVSLTPYRHDPEFLAKAAALVKFDEKGFLHYPCLPPRDPRTQ